MLATIISLYRLESSKNLADIESLRRLEIALNLAENQSKDSYIYMVHFQ